MNRNKKLLIILLFSSVFVFSARAAENDTYLGASLYFSPLQNEPRAGNNFTITVKADSLAQPVNAITGTILFDQEKLEIINVSKIGSVLNIWVEEPNFSNLEGKLSFQGGLAGQGFMGNGGTLLHIIFRAKSSGIASVAWEKAEVLAHDGKGTNILTNLQNYEFVVSEAFMAAPQKEEAPLLQNSVFILNIILLAILGLVGAGFYVKSILRAHDREFHEKLKEINENKTSAFAPTASTAVQNEEGQL